MYTKVLLPLDGSQFSEHVVPYAAQLAAGGAEIMLLHVSAPEGARSNHEVPSETYFAEVAAALKGRGAGKVSVKLASGEPAVEIIHGAADAGCDLIAMTTHGRGGIGRWMLGSTADKVLQACDLPLLLVRPAAGAQLGPLTNLMVPLDGSDLAETALTPARHLAIDLRLPLTLMRVLAPYGAVYEAGGPGFDPQLEEDLEKIAQKYLAATAARVRGTDLQVRTQVWRGWAATEILTCAEGTPGTLVVMSTHGRGGAGRWVLGSVADRVVRGSKAPVLLYRAPVGRTDAAAA